MAIKLLLSLHGPVIHTVGLGEINQVGPTQPGRSAWRVTPSCGSVSSRLPVMKVVGPRRVQAGALSEQRSDFACRLRRSATEAALVDRLRQEGMPRPDSIGRVAARDRAVYRGRNVRNIRDLNSARVWTLRRPHRQDAARLPGGRLR